MSEKQRFHPLKAGRRQPNALVLYEAGLRFHPLKAGRRLASHS